MCVALSPCSGAGFGLKVAWGKAARATGEQYLFHEFLWMVNLQGSQEVRGTPPPSADLGGGEEGKCVLTFLRGSKLHERVRRFPWSGGPQGRGLTED